MKSKFVRLGKLMASLMLATIIGLTWVAAPVEAKPAAPAKRIYLVTIIGFDEDNPVGAECFKFTKEEFWALGNSRTKGEFEVTDKDGKKTAFRAAITIFEEVSGIDVAIEIELLGRAEAGGPGSTVAATGLAEAALANIKQNLSFSGIEMKKSECKKLAKQINKALGLDD